MESADDARAALELCLTDLADNAPAEGVLQRLREIEPELQQDPLALTRARFLRARAVATNRLGFAGDALGDLHEARRLLEGGDYPAELAEIFRAIATVFTWRGDSREAALALLRVVAEAFATDDKLAVSLALIEAGRLQMEIGHPGEAQALLRRALGLAGTLLPQREFQRAWVNLLQASVAAGMIDHAQVQLVTMNLTLAQTTPRLLLLADLEAARCAVKENDFSGADAALDRALTHAPDNQDAFERVEIAEAEAELALARGDAQTAATLLNPIIARHADDDLAAREVRARLIQAQALEALGRTDEAERTLGAALRRATVRALTGYADEIRSRLMTDYGGPARIADMPMAGAETESTTRFVRQRPLGSGAFGRVFRAYDLELGIEVAIKRAARGENYDPETRDSLMQAARMEVAATARLDHPGVARVFGLLPLQGGDTLVIEEFVEGPTLRAAMETGLDHARGFSLLSRIAFALAAVHGAGVIHRDLKPDNIILRGGDAPVLIDFGIALLEDGVDRPGTGTPAYMAPEQAKGRNVDARADLYALGVIAHEMLTGERPEPPRSLLPFTGKARHQRIEAALAAASVDPRVAALIARLLAAQPRSRPQSAGAVGSFFAKAGEASR